MAEAVVSAVLHQLLTIVDREVGQEVRLVVGVEQQVQKMKSTFRSIQAVLVDAENRQYLKKDGEAVKVWLDKLKHISYDIDHVLDEWNTAILKSQIERDHSFLPSKVCSCIPSHYSCFGKLALPLRHDIAQRIEELNKKLEVISREKDDFSFAVGLNSSTVGLNSSTERPKTTSLIDESHVYGREHDKDALVDRLLLSDNNNEGGSDGAEVQRRVESSHGNVRHLTLTPNVEQHLPIIDGIKGVENLRSFLFPAFIHTSDNLQILTESLPKLFLQLSNLRMLVFYTNVAGLEFLKEIGKLIHLRYLSLEGNLGLIELPEALCDLYNLQTLNIRSCLYLRKLPLKIEKLINLRHLQNEHTRNITFMPKGMGKLTSLQTLEEFVVKKGGGTNQNERPCSLEDLGKLIHLRGHLRIKRLGDYVGEEASAARTREALLSTKAGLHSLGLDFRGEIKEGRKRKEEEALLLQALHPPPHLQISRIESCPASAFPNWITLLTSLKWVTLYRCYNWESLPPMGNLPSLESLTIGGMYKVRKVGEELLGVVVGRASPSSVNQNIAFPNLKKLEFGGMDAWEG
ncbi:putative disease resistance protein RGA4-like protein [Corchorus olitorius]|uniref:Disease resistance protein RGA4-like protein n=1 Tax=Corchorus olitorius TaxID=93759 RepID=A0A1R3KGJ4_9ROSI|nr:putative disease resistance protein RGA4-like protein [Corchorus olitorius]